MEETCWRRAWNDTKHGWGNWPFIWLEAVVSPIVGFCVGVATTSAAWGFMAAIGVVVVGLVSVSIGATAHAPIAQRNEARALHASLANVVTLTLLMIALADPVPRYPGTGGEWHGGNAWARLATNPNPQPVRWCYLTFVSSERTTGDDSQTGLAEPGT